MNEITPLQPGSPITVDSSLRHALLDSRQRWRDLVMTVADLVFETDASGRFIFLAPDPVLGWPTAALIGQPAELLLACGIGPSTFNPFRLTVPVKTDRRQPGHAGLLGRTLAGRRGTRSGRPRPRR